MKLTPEIIQAALKDLGLTVETDGESYIHTTRGRFAPLIHAILTPDPDGTGATLMGMVPDTFEADKRTVVCELLNLAHGQSLWNIRFHLDEDGRVLAISRLLLWGKPLNNVQLGDIFYSLLVTTDRLYPCLRGIHEGQTADEAFERFFLSRAAASATEDSGDDDDEHDGSPGSA